MSLATLDMIVIGIVLLFGLLGLLSGLISQVVGILALVAAWFLSRPAGKIVGDYLAHHSQLSPSSTYVVGCFIAGVAIFVAIKLGYFVISRMMPKGEGGANMVNKLLGGLFGAAKAFAVAYLLLCLVAGFPQHFEKHKPDLSAMLKGSQMERLIGSWNPVTDSKLLGSIRCLQRISNNPEAIEELKADPRIKEFLGVVKRKLSEVTKDKATLRRIEAGDTAVLMRAENLLRLVKDPEVVQAFQEIDLNAALAEASRKAR